MAYKRGGPLVNHSFVFKIASAIVFYFVWIIAIFVCKILYSVRYENRRLIRRFKGNAILVANHTTLLDPVMISGVTIPRLMYHTMLESTVETPILGTFTRLLGGVPLPRGMSGLEKMLASAPEMFRHRRFILVYPEGECFLYNQIVNEHKFGAYYIAAKLNLPVIPVVTVFSEGRFPAGAFFARKLPRVHLVILDPVMPSTYIRYKENSELDLNSVKELANTVQTIMQNEIDNRHAKNPRWGTQAYFKGKMPRMKGINHENT
ncbi:MAG: 1-acyl-sn-glycerol-3-phosphate acyltransferase [Spirochaetaceae bacterium]|jgi:1-acyl-sn-glycerol-3-phosphate acyltransferase|nr:1-acyl-sn-glycerol-3-phosphate acyltransferase [Spirochaetaceae bacterium]